MKGFINNNKKRFKEILHIFTNHLKIFKIILYYYKLHSSEIIN